MSEKDETNLARHLSEDKRKELAKKICQDYDTDCFSRAEWESRRNRFYKLWMTQRDPKNTPFPGASNVCLPLLAVACNQFHARSYQAMFTPQNFLKTIAVGAADLEAAKRVEYFMNWQLQHDIPNYEEEHDKLLLAVPINGGGNIKVTFDNDGQRPVVDYVPSMDLVLPYRTRSLRTARRYTHRMWLHYDELVRRAQKKGRYIDFDKVSETPSSSESGKIELEQTKDEVEGDAYEQGEKPHLILEQYLYWQGPKDTKPMPYIGTVDYDSQTLLRLTSRVMQFRKTEMLFECFVDYGFFPNIEGYYPFGFGHFLEQLNEMANTAFNQIFDSGRLTNQPFGFYGRRAGVKRRELKLWPGRMEEIEDASQIYFPSMQRVDQVLFQVLGLIEQFSQQFTSTGDYLMGRESKGTKTPTASGTLAIIEQGLVLYNVMIKRLFRSLKEEFRLIYMANKVHLPVKKQFFILEDETPAFPEAKRKDFDYNMHLVCVGDPTYASKLTRRQEAAEIYSGILNNPLYVSNNTVQVVQPKALLEATKTWLETFDRRDMKKLLPRVPPDPKDPIDENAMFFQGDYVEPVPGEDVVAHLEVHERFKTTPYYNEMDEEKRALLDKHIDATKAMAYKVLEAQRGLGAQLPPGQPPDQSTEPAAPPAEVAPTMMTPGPEESAVSPDGNPEPVPQGVA